MAELPVSLDNLITYVRSLQPGGGPLEQLTSAMSVSTQLDEQSDALIGYFVDQARRSGASWSQIGASMGVSKQAAQKRFVPRGLAAEVPAPFSRFTPRAASVLAAAGQLAGAAPVGSAHLAAGLLTEPDGIAARVVGQAGLTPEQFTAAVGAGPAPVAASADPAALEALDFGDDAEEALKCSLRAALGLGHNYIGTEHILLGVLAADGPVSEGLAGAGLDAGLAGHLIAAELTALTERRGKAC
jgi:hypothetical protein